MARRVEQTNILVPTEDLGSVLESLKVPVLQNICKIENLDTAGGKKELTSRIRKRAEEAQPKYQRQQKVFKLASEMAAEVGTVSELKDLITEQIENLGRKLEAHIDKRIEHVDKQLEHVDKQLEAQHQQVATLAQQMDELLAYLPTMWNPEGIQKIRRKGQEAAAVEDANRAAGGTHAVVERTGTQ